MKKIIYSILALLFLAAASFSKDISQNPKSAKEINQNLPEFKNVNCSFKELKNIKNSPKSIESGGRFKFIKNEGVVFQTMYPIRSTSYTRGQNKQISDIVSAVLSKNFTYLEENFDTYFMENKSAWTLNLKPRKDFSFDDLTIQGTDYIKKITMNSSSIGKTTLIFYCGK